VHSQIDHGDVVHSRQASIASLESFLAHRSTADSLVKKHVLVSQPDINEESKNIAGLHKADFQKRRGSLSILLSARPTIDDLQKMAQSRITLINLFLSSSLLVSSLNICFVCYSIDLPAPTNIAASRSEGKNEGKGIATAGNGSNKTYGAESIPMTVDALLSATKRLEHNTDDDVRMEDVGGLYMWGTNNHGQLGLDSTTDAKLPEVSPILFFFHPLCSFVTLLFTFSVSLYCLRLDCAVVGSQILCRTSGMR
jgi:hypothetical protein